MERQVNVRVAENEYRALLEISEREGRRISQTVRLFVKRYMPQELARLRARETEIK